ncbi:MAG: nitroreductase family protein [Mycobacterium leprae]
MAETANRYAMLGLERLDPLLNPVLETMAAHRSVRSFDGDRPLPDGTLEALAVAAQSAATSSNLHSYSMIALTDPGHKAEVIDLCGEYAFFKECPLFLVFCVDIRRLQRVCEIRERPFHANTLNMFLTGAVDAALAAENTAVAAESMGLGTCMCGALRATPEAVADALRLPPGVFALVGLGIGYPKQVPPLKPRLPLSVMLHHEYYSLSAQEEGLAAYDRTMAESGAYAGRRVATADSRDGADTEFYGWLEHTARRLSDAHDGYYTSREYREILARLGFRLE